MSDTDKNLRSRLFSTGTGGEPSEALIEALTTRFDSGEAIVHRLPGDGVLEHEDDGTETIRAVTEHDILAVATDRRLFFAVETADSERIIPIPYTDIRAIDVDDGLLHSRLTVRVWASGTYTMEVSDTKELGRAVSYLSEASDIWQRVVAALQETRKATAALETNIEAGRIEQAREARETATRNLDRAAEKLDDATIETGELADRYATATGEFHRAEIRARLTRAETLMTEGRHQTDSAAYAGAYRSYWHARDHLENALMIAIENDIKEPALIQSKLDAVETSLDHLEIRPLALAKQAGERAERTGNIDDEVEAWAAAFEHYRDALTAGWGTGLDFAGNGNELRQRIESVVGSLIEARRNYARQLEAEADRHKTAEEFEHARHGYATACSQLDSARQLAREFRSGDTRAIRDQRHRVDSKLEAVRWELGTA